MTNREKQLRYLDDDDLSDDALCHCPICHITYIFSLISESPCCSHLLCDWCFTADYDGGARGYWATPKGAELLVNLERSVDELHELLAQDWPNAAAEREVIKMLPPDMRPRRGSIQWEGKLGARIAAVPGYIGTHSVKTNSMAGDAWDVHWAEDGAEAAAAIDPLLEADLAAVTSAIARARVVMQLSQDDQE